MNYPLENWKNLAKTLQNDHEVMTIVWSVLLMSSKYFYSLRCAVKLCGKILCKRYISENQSVEYLVRIE